MNLFDIRKAFERILAPFATANGLEVAWENTSFSPKTATYLSAFLLPAQDTHDTICYGNLRVAGVYQINIHAPINVGTAPIHTLTEQIKALYPVGSRIGVGADTVRITTPINTSRGVLEKERYVVNISIFYSNI